MRIINRKVWLILLLLWLGFIPLKVKAQNTEREKKMSQELNRLDESPFGVLEFLNWNHPWNSYKYPDKKSLERVIKLIKEAGAGWVRMDFAWSDIEPAQGRFDFAKTDLIIKLLSENNIKVLGILDYSADWASACGQWNCPPVNALFLNYAVKVVSRYKDRVKYWEIWNEPDSYTYWTTQDGLKTYCVLLKEVYPALKKADPECQVLNGGFADALSSANKLYDNGAKDYFDIMNIHVFDSPLNSGSSARIAAYPKAVRKIMERNQDAKKELWITETGCPGLPAGKITANWWMGKNPTEAEQAEFLKDCFTRLIEEKYANKIFWAFFRDCQGHWGNGVDYFGLIRWDFSPKPSFFAYQEVFRQWKNGK